MSPGLGSKLVLKAPPLVHLWKLMVEQNGSSGRFRDGEPTFGVTDEKVAPNRFTLTLSPARGPAPPAGVFCRPREAAAGEEGAEAEGEVAPRGRGRGGRDHRSDNFFPATAAAAGSAAAGSGSTGLRVGFRGSCWWRRRGRSGARAGGTSEAPSVRRGEAAEGRPRPAGGRLAGCHHLPAAVPSGKSHRGPGCGGQTDAQATRQARGQPLRSPTHAGSGHPALLVSRRARVCAR